MFRDTAQPASATPSGTEAQRTFKPSISSIREHIARRRADRILDQFAERFTEDNYFPEGGDGLLFAMLTWLPQWPVNMGIVVVDNEGETLASYLKGNDWMIVEQTITFVQRDDGTYSAPGSSFTYLTESLFWVLFSQIPSTSEIGRYGDDISVESRIATLRGQISRAARMERALLFEALMADAHVSKSESRGFGSNPYLPFWAPLPQDWPLALWPLHEVNPELPVALLVDLLLNLPFTDDQEADLLDNDTLPETFFETLQASRDEWSHHRAIDGLRHKRVYDAQTDDLARALAGRLLKDRLARDLVITELGESKYRPAVPDDNPVIVVHFGNGIYGRGDEDVVKVRPSGRDVDSFYLAIVAQLQPDEFSLMGLESDNEIEGVRTALANLAIEYNGGWFTLHEIARPAWFSQASSADKLAWKEAMQAYSQAVLDAQTPQFLDVENFAKSEQLRMYARQKLQDRLEIDLGYVLDPDQITILIPINNMTVGAGSGGFLVARRQPSKLRKISLTDLALENIVWGDYAFLTRARVVDNRSKPVTGLTTSYIYDLVRELNIADSYADFLRARLLTSPEGQWSKERYAQVEQAQMRLDALEAKMAGDFLEDGKSPAGQEDRGYKWVMAVLDHPVDDGKRPLVERHQIQVGRLRIASKTKPRDAVIVDDILVIQPASSFSARPAVIYTPEAQDGVRFEELTSLEDLRPSLGDPEFQEYLISLVPAQSKPRIRWALVNKWQELKIDVVPDAAHFLEQRYERKVHAVIASVDEHTTSTWEANWKAAWYITRFAGEIALAFVPFKISLPIAAIRSMYAMSQAIKAAVKGDQNTSLFFIDAAMMLAGGLPGGRGGQLKKAAVTVSFNAKAALRKTPTGLSLRMGGVFKGIYEASDSSVLSRFFVKEAGKTYPVRYDQDYATWRLIDPRRPDAYYQAPISFEGGVWTHAKVGLLGGGRKAAKQPTPGSSGASGAPKRYTLDVAGFENSKPFKKADPHIQDALRQSVEKVTEKYIERGGGKFHGYEEKGTGRYISTFDLTGIPGGKGRGPWRLQVIERVVLDANGQVVKIPGQPGVLEFDKLLPSH